MLSLAVDKFCMIINREQVFERLHHFGFVEIADAVLFLDILRENSIAEDNYLHQLRKALMSHDDGSSYFVLLRVMVILLYVIDRI